MIDPVELEEKAEQIRSTIELLGPLSEWASMLGVVLMAHHPEGNVADDCAVCASFRPGMVAIMDRCNAARQHAITVWGITEDELDGKD